ncbi:hypothetical protein P7K49_033060 [Saguinus oedipus]|uniref:Uncharacterized protein n=1 Tax=Saguinus oedipus TaxID=9490 RepID=A0ABQ9TQV1_SAGOE|nr:hypothetical protein P7K49_033060 [Saguinus oedipus]
MRDFSKQEQLDVLKVHDCKMIYVEWISVGQLRKRSPDNACGGVYPQISRGVPMAGGRALSVRLSSSDGIVCPLNLSPVPACRDDLFGLPQATLLILPSVLLILDSDTWCCILASSHLTNRAQASDRLELEPGRTGAAS